MMICRTLAATTRGVARRGVAGRGVAGRGIARRRVGSAAGTLAARRPSRGCLAALLLFCMLGVSLVGEAGQAQENRRPSVGAPGFVEGVVLPGPELIAKPLKDDRAPLVVRIVEVYPHGEMWRYDIAFQGLEPGQYDLTEYLQRKDGAEAGDLPPIEVEILSLLPPGQVEPNQLDVGFLPGVGGYRGLAVGLVLLWVLVLLGLVFWGRRQRQLETDAAPPETLQTLLRPRLELALKGHLSAHQFAELERMLIGFWRRRLGLEDLSASQAVASIKEHAEAGPLMKQLELQLHDRPQTGELSEAELQNKLASLLQPYQSMSINELSADEIALVRS